MPGNTRHRILSGHLRKFSSWRPPTYANSAVALSNILWINKGKKVFPLWQRMHFDQHIFFVTSSFIFSNSSMVISPFSYRFFRIYSGYSTRESFPLLPEIQFTIWITPGTIKTIRMAMNSHPNSIPRSTMSQCISFPPFSTVYHRYRTVHSSEFWQNLTKELLVISCTHKLTCVFSYLRAEIRKNTWHIHRQRPYLWEAH